MYVSQIINDTIHYFTAESYRDSKIIRKDTSAYQSIYGGDLASGINYFKVDSTGKTKSSSFIHSLDYDKYYQKFDTLPQDTILDLSNSILSNRGLFLPHTSRKGRINNNIHYFNREYVLSMPNGKHFLIPYNQLSIFLKNNDTELYGIYMRNQHLTTASLSLSLTGCFAYLGGIGVLIAGAKHTTPHLLYAGAGALGLSLICLTSSSLIIRRRTDIIDVYNKKASKSTPYLSLNVNVGANGVGLSLQF